VRRNRGDRRAACRFERPHTHEDRQGQSHDDRHARRNAQPAIHIWVFLFPSAEIAGARPIATEVVRKNGGTATFANVTQSPVYIRTVYDEKGDYDGFSGPRPAGAPIGQYSKDATTIAPVTPGPGAKIKVVFSDSFRHP